ncbi:hypothetical protein [Sphingomonas sp. 28-63-12]|uniref:hypothetical protein n=1 Tax=Sphingomonas sp. 28-63-12 TaxID=1970434 RepID=UPI000BD25838|nr:MAG: hypothetical protein B7Y47_03245 [Sphingomonas sp. 28-63-12]
MQGGGESIKRARAGSVWRGLTCLFLASLMGTGAAQSPAPAIVTVDPLTIADDDFARNRDPETWRDLTVERIVFTEAGATWRLWRIINLAHPDGPLWEVMHDNENATFAAALVAVRSWGGVVMVVDTGPVDTRYGARFNSEVAGTPIDPNRNFSDARPSYVAHMLADLGDPPRLIVALHTNAPDFDPRLSDCPSARPGRGAISVGLCNDRYHPRAAQNRRWPFDDNDSLALVPYLATRDRSSAPCGRALSAADYNLVFERVAISDGSLSNYAVQHGLAYVNIETEERGSAVAGIALARDRLVDMIDGVMARCGPVAGLALKAPRGR